MKYSGYANGFMDYFAAKRNLLLKSGKRFGVAVSINWPLWEEGGMRADQQTREWARRSAGLETLTSESGLEIFVKGLSFNKNSFLPVSGHDLTKLRQKLSVSDTPRQASESPPAKKEAQDSENKLAEKLKEKLSLMVADILKTGPEEIDLDEELREYGFDSITFVELTNRSAADFGLELTPDILMETPTINRFASYLLENHSEQIEKIIF